MGLADLLVGMSRLADLGFGLPAGAALRSCALGTRLARTLDLPDEDVQATFYTALMHHVGCAGYAHETAQLFGNELVANMAAARTDPASLRDLVATFLPTLTQGRAPIDRARLTLTALTKGDRWGSEFTTTSCEVGRDTARRLLLSQEVQSSLFHVFDMWRRKGGADSLNGADIPIAARIARLTGIAVLFESIAGTDGAVQAVRRRAGGMLDPHLVACFTDHAAAWLGELAESDVRTLVLDAEPHPRVTVPNPHLVAEVFADLADLKSPYLHGHSRAVAALASGAAAHLRLREATRDDLEIAGLLHDVGRVAISNAVWDKPGQLTAEEWELVRLHAYHSERILAGSAQLERIVPLVGRHHERLDGTGYHRGSHSEDLSMAARILAAADMYRTLTEHRPHRAALAPEKAQRRVLDEAERKTGHGRGRRRARGRGASSGRATSTFHGALRARSGGAGAGDAGLQQPGDRCPPRHLTPHSGASRAAHLLKDRRLQPRRRDPLRDRAPSAGPGWVGLPMRA